MYFGTKSYLKSTRNHTTKHALNASNVALYIKETDGPRYRRGPAPKTEGRWITYILIAMFFLEKKR